MSLGCPPAGGGVMASAVGSSLRGQPVSSRQSLGLSHPPCRPRSRRAAYRVSLSALAKLSTSNLNLNCGAKPSGRAPPLVLPFATYGDVKAAGLEISVTCIKCDRSVLIDAGSEGLRDRRLCGARLVCTRVLPHGPTCTGYGLLKVEHGGSWAAQLARAPNRVFRP